MHPTARLPLVLLFLMAGCATGGSTYIDRWANSRGGLVVGQPAATAAEAAIQRLSIRSLSVPELSIEVLDCNRPLAYAWPCGRLFVTRGLVETLTADELVAAIAHEVGHLLADPAPTRDVALSGIASDHRDHDACEAAADIAGRRLLADSGIDNSAMIAMLRKVASHPETSPAIRRGMLYRAELLRRQE